VSVSQSAYNLYLVMASCEIAPGSTHPARSGVPCRQTHSDNAATYYQHNGEPCSLGGLGVDIAARQRFLVGDYVECCLPKSVLASERSKTELWFIIARPLAAARYIRSMSLR